MFTRSPASGGVTLVSVLRKQPSQGSEWRRWFYSTRHPVTASSREWEWCGNCLKRLVCDCTKVNTENPKMSFYENFVVFCSWLIHRSDKCIRISSWKGILQILQRGKKNSSIGLSNSEFDIDSTGDKKWRAFSPSSSEQLPLLRQQRSLSAYDYSSTLLGAGSDWTRAENMCFLFICKNFTQIFFGFWLLPSLSGAGFSRIRAGNVCFVYFLAVEYWQAVFHATYSGKNKKVWSWVEKCVEQASWPGQQYNACMVINIKLWSGQFLSQ